MSQFFKCVCGKLHASAYVGVASTCVCGENLWVQVWLGVSLKHKSSCR